MKYATLADLAAFLGQEISDLPASADRLLDRASELFESVSLGRYNEPWIADDAIVMARLVRAECAQAEYWIAAGEAVDVEGGGIKAYTAGSVSVTRESGAVGSGSSLSQRLAPRSRDALFLSGMLNSGVDVGI